MFSLQLVEQYLQRMDWKYKVEDNKYIRTGLSAENCRFDIYITVFETYMRIEATPEGTFRSLGPQQRIKVLELINTNHGSKVFSRIYFDKDNDLTTDWCLPICEGNTINFESFKHCLFGIISSVDQIYPELMKIRWEN